MAFEEESEFNMSESVHDDRQDQKNTNGHPASHAR